MELKIEYLSVNNLTPYENNARKHETEDVEYIKNSIKEFGMNDPIGIWSDKNIIVEGHGRLIACKSLGIKEVPCIRLDNLTDEQRKAYALAHNKTAEMSAWDFDLLDEELDKIFNIDMGDFGFDLKVEKDTDDEQEKEEHQKLSNKFGVPPFSVLDTRQGYWQERKDMWLNITGNLSETRDGEFGRLSNSNNESILDTINDGTSNFDPVLAEISYKWFNRENGKILDPFGGEQTKGVVAGALGYKYSAVEFRKEQCELNRKKTEQFKDVKYYNGDSNDISKIIKERDFDMLFTSPPYYDLEVYSKDDMSALGTYEQFMAQYENIFRQCVEMLKDNTFCVIKVAEIRNKKTGQYRCFVADNIKMFEKIGMKFYNDIVLINKAGTAPLRASRSMANRKIVKLHQNILVFYKGDMNKIKEYYPEIEIGEF